MPGLNATIDRFADDARTRDLPTTLINHRGAPQAFDVLEDSDSSRVVIRQVLSFLRLQLLVGE